MWVAWMQFLTVSNSLFCLSRPQSHVLNITTTTFPQTLSSVSTKETDWPRLPHTMRASKKDQRYPLIWKTWKKQNEEASEFKESISVLASSAGGEGASSSASMNPMHSRISGGGGGGENAAKVKAEPEKKKSLPKNLLQDDSSLRDRVMRSLYIGKFMKVYYNVSPSVVFFDGLVEEKSTSSVGAAAAAQLGRKKEKESSADTSLSTLKGAGTIQSRPRAKSLGDVNADKMIATTGIEIKFENIMPMVIPSYTSTTTNSSS